MLLSGKQSNLTPIYLRRGRSVRKTPWAHHHEVRQRLQTLKAEIEALLAIAGDESQPVALDQQSVGRLSRMDALQRHEMAKAQDAARRRDLTRIAAALRRLDKGEYGECIDCGEPIPERRLEIDPTAERCVGCAGGTR